MVDTPYNIYAEQVLKLADLREKNNGKYGGEEEGELLDQMTETWMFLSDQEREKAKFLLRKVPCAKRDMDHIMMLPSKQRFTQS